MSIFNVIIPSTPSSLKWFLPSRFFFPTETLYSPLKLPSEVIAFPLAKFRFF
jgi:hypothetical protein